MCLVFGLMSETSTSNTADTGSAIRMGSFTGLMPNPVVPGRPDNQLGTHDWDRRLKCTRLSYEPEAQAPTGRPAWQTLTRERRQ